MPIDTKFKNKIRAIANVHEKHIKDDPNMNEADTKENLIIPIIKDLLNFNPFDISREFNVPFSGDKKECKVDYCIKKNGKPILIIEAKKYGSLANTIDNKIMEQLLVYSHNALKQHEIKIAILTDGNRWLFYNVADKLVEYAFLDFMINAQDYIDEDIDLLQLFTKDNFRLSTIIPETKKRLTQHIKHLEQKGKVEKIQKITQAITKLLANPSKELREALKKSLIKSNKELLGKTTTNPKDHKEQDKMVVEALKTITYGSTNNPQPQHDSTKTPKLQQHPNPPNYASPLILKDAMVFVIGVDKIKGQAWCKIQIIDNKAQWIILTNSKIDTHNYGKPELLKQLISKGICDNNGIFIKDYPCYSANNAGGILFGRNKNAYAIWNDSDGRSLQDWTTPYFQDANIKN